MFYHPDLIIFLWLLPIFILILLPLSFTVISSFFWRKASFFP